METELKQDEARVEKAFLRSSEGAGAHLSALSERAEETEDDIYRTAAEALRASRARYSKLFSTQWVVGLGSE